MEDDWETSHFKNRRIPHGRQTRGRGKGSSKAFDPRSTFGVYSILCPSLKKLRANPTRSDVGVLLRQGGRRIITDTTTPRDARLEIHGLVEGHDDALMATLDLDGIITAVAVLAGSRKVLQKVVKALEGEDESGSQMAKTASPVDPGETSSIHDTATPVNDDEDQSGSDDQNEKSEMSSIEAADERDRRRIAAFEKNSFRTPKFWMRWRGVVASPVALQEPDSTNPTANVTGEDTDQSDGHTVAETNLGYVVFEGNGCDSLQGTISCNALEWKNVKISASKVTSKARECPVSWTDY